MNIDESLGGLTDNMNRRKSREVAMKLVFEMSIRKEGYNSTLETFLENLETDSKELDMEYIQRILKGVEENIDIINKKIEENLIGWKLYRLSKIDLAILKLAVYELLFEDEIPEKVTLNEAIELAKKFSEEKSASFINGVLDSVTKGEL